MGVHTTKHIFKGSIICADLASYSNMPRSRFASWVLSIVALFGMPTITSSNAYCLLTQCVLVIEYGSWRQYWIHCNFYKEYIYQC